MPQDPMDSGELLSHLFLMSALANLTTFRVIACTMLSVQSHGTLSTIINLSLTTLPEHRAVVHDCLIKGFGMSSRVYATGHVKDPVPPIVKSRASCPSGRFPPSFIHQVIVITGLNKL